MIDPRRERPSVDEGPLGADPASPDADATAGAVPAEGTDAPQSGGAKGGGGGLLRSSAVMAVATVVSRITGLGRTLALLWALGSALFADAFQLANTLPNSLYILIGGGALNAVFIPQLVRAMKRDSDGGEAFGQRLLTLVVLLLGGLTVLLTVGAWLVIWLFASNDLREPSAQPYFDLAVTFAFFLFPQVFFYGMYTIFGQILNARNNFGPMMWAPILNNVISIAVFGAFILVDGGTTPESITPGQITLLGLGSTLGIVAQAACLIPVLRKTGFRLRLRFDLRGAGLAKSGKLAFWTMGFVLINQFWFWVATKLGTGAGVEATQAGLEAGYGFTPYITAFTVAMMPHAVIAVSIVTALLPQISRSAADGDAVKVRADLSYGMRLTAVTIIPASAVFLALAPQLTVGLLQHSESMSRQSALVIGYILMGFAPALIGFSTQYIALRGFYAYEDTRTPFLIQIVVVGASSITAFALSTVLPVEWKVVGISLAYGVGYWIGLVISLTILRRRLGHLGVARLARTFLTSGAAAAIAGGAAYAVAWLITGQLGDGAWPALLALVVGGLVLLVGYLGLAKVFRIREIGDVLGLVKGKVGR